MTIQDLRRQAAAVCEMLRDEYDIPISTVDLLDVLASFGLSLTDDGPDASDAYMEELMEDQQ